MARTTWTRPISTFCISFFAPPRSPQAYPAFRVKNVGDDLMIAHSPRHPPRGAIKETTSVLGAVRAEPVDFQRQTVVQIATYRPSHNGDTYKPSVCHAADRKLMPMHWLVVAMILRDKSVSLSQTYWYHLYMHIIPPPGARDKVGVIFRARSRHRLCSSSSRSMRWFSRR